MELATAREGVIPFPYLYTLSLVAFLLLAIVVPAGFCAAQVPVKAKPAVPGAPCLTGPLQSWTPQEQWVWQEVCQGKIADFNKTERYGGELDPKILKGWPSNRVLRPAFLETILLHEPYRSALTNHGVRIVGTWFTEPIDLSNATLAHPLLLDYSRFDKDVSLKKLKSSHFLELDGSKFYGELDMDSLRTENSLHMRDGEFAEVNLMSARIGSQLTVQRSRFTGKLDLESLQVTEDLLAHKAEFAGLSLVGAKIGGALVMTESKFVSPSGAGSEQAERINMDSLQVGNSLFMRDVKVTTKADVVLVVAAIGVNLDISGSTLRSLDLAGASVRGEFQLAQGDQHVKWQEGSELILRNAQVGALQDHQKAWPNEVDLVGFTYDRLGGIGMDSSNNMANRDLPWFEEWLNKQKRYSPQPYAHLASVLRKAGHEDKANGVLYAGRERERKATTWQNRVWLTFLKYAIGYGYGYGVFYSLIWAFVFTGIGTAVLRGNKEGQAKGILWSFLYSFDMLLPIIELDKRHYEVRLDGFARYYFYLHILVGYLLASFVVAGISGLTR